MALFQKAFSRLRPTVQRSSAIPYRGLEEFFESRASVPTEEIPAGRAWSAEELHRKSFDELHKLWYVLVKERNMLATQEGECARLKADFLHKDRIVKVKRSMARIKTVMTERQAIWEEHKASEKNRAREELAKLGEFGNQPSVAANNEKARKEYTFTPELLGKVEKAIQEPSSNTPSQSS